MHKYYRGHHVDTVGGERLFYPIRGLCDDPYHQGRHVDYNDGDKVFVYAPECCQPPLDPLVPGEGWVPDDIDTEAYSAALAAEPFIIKTASGCCLSRVVMIYTTTFSGCGDRACQFNYAYYVEAVDATISTTACGTTIPPGSGYWHGFLNELEVVIWCEEDEVFGPVLKGCVSAACMPAPDHAADLGLFGTAGCDGCPATGTKNFLTIGECCSCYDPDPDWSPPLGIVHLHMKSFCSPKRSGRHVDTLGGERVFITDLLHCDAYCSSDQNCCSLLRGCPLTVDIVDNSACGDIDLTGSYLFNPVPGTDTQWDYSFFGERWVITCTAGTGTGASLSFNGTFSYSDPDKACLCNIEGFSEETSECSPLDVTFSATYDCGRIYGTGDCCTGSLTVRIRALS